MPHISIYDITVSEADGFAAVVFNRTGGDLTVPSHIFASTVNTSGTAASSYVASNSAGAWSLSFYITSSFACEHIVAKQL